MHLFKYIEYLPIFIHLHNNIYINIFIFNIYTCICNIHHRGTFSYFIGIYIYGHM